MKTLLKNLFIVAIAITFASCDETVTPTILDPRDAQELQADAIENAKAHDASGGTMNAISTYGISEDLTKNFSKSEPQITYDSTTFTVTLTYPNNGGEIIIDWNARPRWNTQNLSGEATINQFVYNQTTVNGNLNLTSVGTNSIPALHVQGTLTLTLGGQEKSFDVNQTYTWEEGAETPWLNDDVFSVFGTTKLTGETKTLQTTIEENKKIIKERNCDFPKQGVMGITVERTNRAITIDYGYDADGNISNACDSYVRLTLKVENATASTIVNLNN